MKTKQQPRRLKREGGERTGEGDGKRERPGRRRKSRTRADRCENVRQEREQEKERGLECCRGPAGEGQMRSQNGEAAEEDRKGE